MKFINIIIAIVCITLNLVGAENHWFLKAGLVSSTFKELDKWEKIDPLWKFGYGIGKELSFSNNFYFSLSVEILEKGAVIHDKTIHEAFEDDVYFNDIFVQVKYFEIPLLFKHGFNLTNNHDFKLFSGVTISWPITDNSSIRKKNFSFSVENNPDRPTDYGRGEESGFGNYPIDLIFNFGIEVSYKQFALNIQYALDNREIIWIDSLSEIHKTMHSYQAFLIYYL